MAISEDDLRGLSAAEREALLATDQDDEDLVRELGGKNASDQEGDDAADEQQEEADVGAADDSDAPSGEGEGASQESNDPAVESAEEQKQEQADDTTVEPILGKAPQRTTPEDAADQRKSLRAERAKALTELMEGTIEVDAFQAIEDRVQDSLDALVRAEATDQARTQLHHDTMMAEFESTLRDAAKTIKDAGLDLAANEGALAAEFDRALRMFAGEAAARGLKDVPGNLAASKDALQEAKAYLLRRHGKVAATPAPAPAAPAAPARKVEPVDRSKLPPTLANVPAAADATIANEFAHLENLEGSALERALAKMTPEQQDRYLG